MTEFDSILCIKHTSVEKVLVAHLVQIFPATYEDKLFIPVFTVSAALMLSSVSLMESALVHPVLSRDSPQWVLLALLISLPLIRSPQKYLRKGTMPRIRLNPRPPSVKLPSRMETHVDCHRLKPVCCRNLIARHGVVTGQKQSNL